MEINKEKEIVQLQKLKKWWTGRVLGATFIKVFRNDVDPPSWHLSEETVANDYRNNEEKNMREEGVSKGLYDLYDLEKSIETIGDKKLYTIRYIIEGDLPGGFWKQGLAGRRKIEAVLYLYFPRDFMTRHIFYGFLINENIERGSLARVDLTQIDPIIKSLKLKEPEKK